MVTVIVIVFALQAGIAFVVSTALFDALHWLLHQWERSSNPLLRRFSSWHWVHHKFLGLDMQINPAYARANIWYHVLPEYLTSMAGTALFLLVFPSPSLWHKEQTHFCKIQLGKNFLYYQDQRQPVLHQVHP